MEQTKIKSVKNTQKAMQMQIVASVLLSKMVDETDIKNCSDMHEIAI